MKSFLSTNLFLLPVLAGAQAPPLEVLRTHRTPNGFSAPPRGWNLFGLQANTAVNPLFTFDRSYIIEQADALASLLFSTDTSSDNYYLVRLRVERCWSWRRQCQDDL